MSTNPAKPPTNKRNLALKQLIQAANNLQTSTQELSADPNTLACDQAAVKVLFRMAAALAFGPAYPVEALAAEFDASNNACDQTRFPSVTALLLTLNTPDAPLLTPESQSDAAE